MEKLILSIFNERYTMKKILLGLSILFTILTFVGAIYVLKSGGEMNAGYAIIPMIFTIACINFLNNKTNK